MLNLMPIEQKDKVVNTFVKTLIEKGFINIYDDNNGIDEGKIFELECAKSIFNNIGFVDDVYQDYNN